MADKAAGEKQPSRLGALAEAVGAAKPRGGAPVERWNPPYCGEIDMRIAADGRWYYQGSPIERPAMVQLFASVLRKDAERYVLVTPAERVGISVEDSPFVAVAMEQDQGAFRFVTNLGDEVTAGREHALRFSVDADGGVKPYVHIRGGLWARLTRPLAMDLLQHAAREDAADRETLGIISEACFFPIENAS